MPTRIAVALWRWAGSTTRPFRMIRLMAATGDPNGEHRAHRPDFPDHRLGNQEYSASDNGPEDDRGSAPRAQDSPQLARRSTLEKAVHLPLAQDAARTEAGQARDRHVVADRQHAHDPGRDADVGRVALKRGPIVYCLEGVDHDGIILDRIAIDPTQVSANGWRVEQRADVLGGVNVLRGTAQVIDDDGWEGMLYRRTEPLSKPIEVTAIPYYAWDNRAPGEMRVWLRAVL